MWKEHLDAHWDHMHNTHILWNTTHGISTHTKHFHNIQQQNSHHTQIYCELFHQTIHKHRQTHKPNRSTNRATHKNRPISLLSVIAKDTGADHSPYITSHIPNTPTQHGYKTQHSTVTALHTVNNTIAKGFNQMAPPCTNNHCNTRYKQSFRHNTHTHTNQKGATDQHTSNNHEDHVVVYPLR